MFPLRQTRVSTVFTSQGGDQDEKDNHFRSRRCVFALSTQVFFPIGGEGERKAQEYGAIIGRRPVIIKTSKSFSLSNRTRALLCFNIRLRIMCLLEVEGSSTVILAEINIANLVPLI